MNKINQDDFRVEIDVPVSAAESYRAVSQVQDWWTRDLEGKTSSVGDEFTVRFKDTFVTFKVTKADPSQSYAWHVTDCYLHWLEDKTEWKGTDLLWDVVPSESGSRITMVHRGLTPTVECYNDCKLGWEHFVKASLYGLITKGVGTPEGTEVNA